jgi:PAS domain S-box-containing protein
MDTQTCPPDAVAACPAPEAMTDEEPGKPRILVLDDDPSVLALTRYSLAQDGLECDLAETGRRALELAATTAYDLLLIDIELPDVPGDKVLRQIRLSSRVLNQKVIIISGARGPDDLAGMLLAGADDFLAKPFHVAQLLARAKAALRLKEAQDRSDQLRRDLERSYAGLEACVDERTRDLLKANETLRVEIAVRQLTEKALQRAHAENERLLATISSILIVLDDKGRVTSWNEAAERAFGIGRPQAVGKPLAELPIRWDGTPFLPQLESAYGGQAAVHLDDVAFVRPDGGRAYLGVTLTPIPAGNGMPQGLLLFGADVTERRQLTAQLAQAQKLESIGQLAAGIAHEINTPIQYVGDNTTFLQGAFADLRGALAAYAQLHEAARRGAPDPGVLARVDEAVRRADLEYLGEEIPRAIGQSLEGVGHVAKIVRALKEFSHPGGEEKTAIDINHAVENTITVARNEWKYVADMVTDLGSDLPPVPCLPGELNQVLLNLIINAAHAIGDRLGGEQGDKGTITVTTRQRGDRVAVSIADTGSGIPEAVRSRIFDPFFTTKPVGKGTGQGLAIAHAVIVKKHGGRIDFATEVGRGTTFTIELPLAAEAGT